MRKATVLIVDDHTLFRRLLADMLADEEAIEVVGQAESGSEAIDKARELRPDLILMDVRMPGTDGVEATRAITREMPSVTVLMLTMSEQGDDLVAAMKAGAKGYLLKNVEPADLVRCIQLTVGGHAVIHPAMAPRFIGDLPDPPRTEPAGAIEGEDHGLTDREKEILGLVAQGATNKAIARSLRITETTVKAHVHNILHKLHLFNRVQAAKWAMENHLAH